MKKYSLFKDINNLNVKVHIQFFKHGMRNDSKSSVMNFTNSVICSGVCCCISQFELIQCIETNKDKVVWNNIK